MARYSESRTDRQAALSIPDADIEAALADFSARRGSPIISDYFTAATCLPVSPRECDAALKAVRKAWVDALCGYNADQLHPACFVLREEMRVRTNRMGGRHVLH
jgi:hypothetical protein